jgi:hypothetical protein
VRDRNHVDDGGNRPEVAEIALGITVLAVLVNMGLTLGLGISAPLPWRLLAAFGVPLMLIGLIALGSRYLGVASRLARAIVRNSASR